MHLLNSCPLVLFENIYKCMHMYIHTQKPPSRAMWFYHTELSAELCKTALLMKSYTGKKGVFLPLEVKI